MTRAVRILQVRRARRGSGERGQLSVLLVGIFSITVLLVLGGIDVTAAHLARVRIIDAADGAALDAADALDERGLYQGGLGDAVTISDLSVTTAAANYLAGRPRPAGITSWRVAPGTGVTVGPTAVVVVEGVVDLPITGGALAVFDRPITIQVEARARAPLRG